MKTSNTLINNNPLLHCYALHEGVTAFSTTRHGGVSEGEYTSFNINIYCGDAREHIAANRALLAETLDIDAANLVVPHQVHGVEVCCVDRDYLAQPAYIRLAMTEGVDAVMTQLPRVCVGVSTADCIPVLLYDESRRAVAAVHAGWRGTVGRIVQKTIEAMHKTYGTEAADLRAVVGPGISLANFEVGDEVYAQFAEAGFEMSPIAELMSLRGEALSKAVASGSQLMKWHIDLPKCNQLQMVEMGVPVEQIIMSGICTYDQNVDFFSARRQGINSGRIYSGIIIK